MSSLENKKPGFHPCNVQFQCGTVWYDLEKDTDFDSLCLDHDKPQMFIQATPIPIKSGILLFSVLYAYVFNLSLDAWIGYN